MTIYTSTARFDQSQRALTEDELHRIAPSIFATEAHYSRSDRFAPIPTIEMIRALGKEGFSVVGAKQAVARSADKAPFTKHLLRLRRIDDLKKYTVGDTVMEILLRNGNDGSSAYNLMAGLFRVACLNSLVAKTADLDEVNVRHSGDAIGKVIEGTYRVLDTAEQVMAAPQDWARIKMDRTTAEAYAHAAHVMRFGDEATTHVKPAQLLDARRYADRGDDLWTTFNVVQENAVRGGIHTVGRNANNQVRRGTTREVKGIDQSVNFNKALFAFTDYLAKNKAA